MDYIYCCHGGTLYTEGDVYPFPGVPCEKIELHPGAYTQYRNQLIRTSHVPTISDAMKTLNKPLANIVMDKCDEALKVEFGLEPPLAGPLGELWISPSDLLRGKVALTPPFTRKHLQALTHQGILEIGYEIERKFIQEMEEEKAQAIAQQRKALLDSFDDTMKEEIKACEARERAAAQREIERLTIEFENTLVEALDNLEGRLKEEYETLFERQEDIISAKWQKMMEVEVQRTVEEITAQYLKKMNLQEQVLTKYFRHEIVKAGIAKQYDLGRQEAKFKLRLRQLKHNMECRNLANMMYIICMERRKCYEQKVNIERYYKQEIDKLAVNIDNKQSRIKKLNYQMTVLKQEVALRESCILGIIRQFQKFINFALKSSPTQAEFLLSVEKMMVFELVDAMMKSNLANDLPPCDSIHPWLTPVRYLSEGEIPGLTVEDFHDCLNELPAPKHLTDDEDFLPSFTYKNRLYVREDFRDMILNGIDLKPSDELWSKDVEILMKELKKVVLPSEEGLALEANKVCSSKKLLIESGQESKPIFDDDNIENIPMRSFKKHSVRGATSLTKPSLVWKGSVHNPVNYEKVGIVEGTPTLLSTKTSLEVMIAKGIVKPSTIEKDEGCSTEQDIEEDQNVPFNQEMERIEEVISLDKRMRCSGEMLAFEDDLAVSEMLPAELAIDTRDSIVHQKILMLEKKGQWSVDPRDSISLSKASLYEVAKKGSRLTDARDSVTIIRESLQRLRDPTPCVSKKNDRSSVLSASKMYSPCCQRCMSRNASFESAKLSKRAGNGRSSPPLSSKRESVKMTSAKEINMNSYEKIGVSFNHTATIIKELEKLYKPQENENKHKTAKKHSVQVRKRQNVQKKKYVNPPPALSVVGDKNAKEHLKTSNTFTAERIHSIIDLIKDNPQLLRTFTACGR